MHWHERLSWFATIVACAGLALVACGCKAHVSAKPPCVSACGMLIEDKGNGSMSCSDVEQAEKEIIEWIDKRFCSKDKRMCSKAACDAIFGWQLRLDESVITIMKVNDRPAVPAVGVSNCSTKEMWLGANQSWKKGSYTHEIFHVFQGCESEWKEDGSTMEHGFGHAGWKDAGVYDFIEEVRRE